ncbi:CDP-alcohol phosphatidyltransferase family protein [Halopiger xanaduensis]|nr:CDP-alcohol phosphatidyltransferase family protein [Halopiger xanaduensis]
MSDSEPPIGWGRIRDWHARSTESVGFSDNAFVRAMSLADYCSLASLLFAWAATLLIVSGDPNWGVVAMFGAFLFDKLDGALARRGYGSDYGLEIDSFIDVFTYLVTGALLYHVALAPNVVVSAVVGFAIVAFGGLRLVRHVDEGFGSDDNGSYYRGITVVHVNVVVVLAYLLAQFGPGWIGWAAAPVVVGLSPLMISDYRCYKTDVGHALVAIGGIAAAVVCLALEFGYL